MELHGRGEDGKIVQQRCRRRRKDRCESKIVILACLALNPSLSVFCEQEHFDQGAAADGRFPNRWPAESRLPGFRQFMEIFYDECHKVGSLILEALELALDLQGGRFVAKCCGNASELRLNHYPPIDIKEMLQGEISKIHPHTDLGVITCLFQDSSGGLEGADRDRCGEFIPVTSRSSSEMVVNISETFQRWTNGRVQAGIHQVTIPPHLKSLEEGVIPERYTIAFFVKADRDTFAGALEEFVGEEKPALYDNMTALEFHQWRLATAY